MDTGMLIMLSAWAGVAVWVYFILTTQRKFHPRALFTLFFAEMWERFSFYGMRALLVLYMVKQLAYADEQAYAIYAAYGALVYGTPVLGGLIADKLYGFRKAIMLGATLMAIGHFCMAIENEIFFFSALALLVIGNGFFKPNISSLLGKLYEQGDPRRDSGFSIFYMGINVGAFLAPLTCGYLGETYGWHFGFGLAGVGMLVGLLVFWRGQAIFEQEGLPPNPEKLQKPLLPGLNLERIIIIGSFLTIPFFALLLHKNDTLNVILLVLGAVIVGALLFEALIKSDKTARERIFVILVLFFFHMLFWAFFEQAGSSITLFTERNVDRSIMGNELQTSMFQGVNPLFIILLAPAFSWLWVKLRAMQTDPFTPVKFALGIIQLGLGFGVFVVGAKLFATGGGMVPLVFLLLGYLLHTTGELCLSPVGLSMITKLSPVRIVGFVMGAWFLSISFAHHIAGIIAAQTSISAYLVDYAEYKPDKGQTGKDVFVLKVCDDGDGCDTTTVVMDIKEKGEQASALLPAPAPYNRYVSTHPDQSLAVPLRVPVIDPLEAHRFAVFEEAGQGTHELLGKDSIKYTPPPGYTGQDTMRYVSCLPEEGAQCDTIRLIVTISATKNHRPRALQDTIHAIAMANMPLRIDVLSHYVDLDGDALHLNVLKRSGKGFVEVKPNVHAQLTPEKTLDIYSNVFTYLCFIAIGAGLFLFLLVPVLRRWMHGVH